MKERLKVWDLCLQRFDLKAYAITGQEVLHFSKEVLTQLMVDSATLACLTDAHMMRGFGTKVGSFTPTSYLCF